MMMMMPRLVVSKCRIQHLGVKNYMRSDTIVSATVLSFYMKNSGGASGGKIKIKRVFKGDRGLEGRLVVVEGFGSKNICLSNPRLGDTKLFFLQMGKMRQDISGQALKFRLNDNILKINSRNLKTLIKLRDRRDRSRVIRKQNGLQRQKSLQGLQGLKRLQGLQGLQGSSPQKKKKTFCDLNETVQSQPDCVREPRAIKMMSDASSSPRPLVSTAPPPPPPCSFAPCEAGGTCEEQDGRFSCHCPPSRSGRYCEVETKITDTEAGFTGASYIMLAPLSNSVTRTNIELSFRTFHTEGILLLWLGHTDWLSLAIVGQHLEVKYELGSGPALLRSSSPVVLGEWHSLVFRRYHQDGILQLDREEPVTTRSRGRNKSLNIRDNVYLGGHPLSNTTSYLLGTASGLVGCIRNVNMMRRNVRLVEDVKARREIILCSDHPCREGYCANNGSCLVSRSSRPQCRCAKHWRGRRCLKKKKKRNKKKQKDYHANDTLYFKQKSHRRRRNRKRRGRHYRSRY